MEELENFEIDSHQLQELVSQFNYISARQQAIYELENAHGTIEDVLWNGLKKFGKILWDVTTNDI